MKDKKHIDRLFQEKFKDFEVSPPPHIWDNIQEQLKQPKRKKRIVILPLWAKVSGIAASLVVLLTIGNSIYHSKTTTTIVNISTDTKENPNATKKTARHVKQELTTPEVKVASENSKIIHNNNRESETTLSYPRTTTRQTVLSSSKTTYNYTSSVTTKTPSELQVASNIKENTKVKERTAIAKDNNTYANTNVGTTTTYNKKNQPNNTYSGKRIAYEKTPNNIAPNLESDNYDDLNKHNTIENAIVENQKNIKQQKTNSTTVIENKKNRNKWHVYANIAPVYYNSLGKGSHIDEQFVNNPKQGDINASYGVTVGYAINDNMTLRSGLRKLDLGYNTNDAIVYESVATSASKIISNNIATRNKSTGKTVAILSFSNLNITRSSNNFINKITPVALHQRMSYYEVPMEIEHQLVRKRLGIHLIYGMSTFILDTNTIVSELNGVDTIIGTSNNINPVSFSTNLGVGLNYNLSKTIKLNVEPTFKYQLNAFKNTAGKFTPYVLGLYTGVNYNF